MLDLARATAGEAAGDRLMLIEGTVSDAPPRPFDAAACILFIGIILDDGSKLDLLKQVHRRLKPAAPQRDDELLLEAGFTNIEVLLWYGLEGVVGLRLIATDPV